MTGWRLTSSIPAMMRSLSSCFDVTRVWRRIERANLEKKNRQSFNLFVGHRQFDCSPPPGHDPAPRLAIHKTRNPPSKQYRAAVTARRSVISPC
jgi:hypothetical protein